ncbi:unnamed protein product [Lactuca saligna]|uniref:Uncharacterized protein n=1 Tax=Lactuca saligna TaxID=75948 RepID=A0AA35VEQ5_LACSI|nr:unnamed protein product [Lactuca saligna]
MVAKGAQDDGAASRGSGRSLVMVSLQDIVGRPSEDGAASRGGGRPPEDGTTSRDGGGPLEDGVVGVLVPSNDAIGCMGLCGCSDGSPTFFFVMCG